MSCTQVVCHRLVSAQPIATSNHDSERAAFAASVSSELQRLRQQQEHMQSAMERQHQELLQLIRESLASAAFDSAELLDAEPLHDAQDTSKGNAAQDVDVEVPAPPAEAEPAAPAGGSRKSGGFSDRDFSVKSAKEPEQPVLQRFINGYKFDLLMGLVIVLNMVVLCVEFQMKGTVHLAYVLGLTAGNQEWLDACDVFASMEYIFTFAYTIELLVKLSLNRLQYFNDVINVADALIVIGVAIQVLGFGSAGGHGPNLQIFRVIKLFRIFRLLKVIKFMHHFMELRILLNTMALSGKSLLWGILLILVVIVAAGIFVFTIAADYIEDAHVDIEHREFMFQHFGSAARSAYTMWEATFSAAWTVKASYMVWNIHPAWAWFWIAYIVAVNFAIMRIVAALFIKKTLEVAAQDADRCAADRLQHKQKYARALTKVFQLADTSGDGAISVTEFDSMLENDEVVAMFEQLDVEIPELKLLFDVLATDDNEADYDEFLTGVLKMKNSARCIDAIQILHELGVNKRTSQSCLSALETHMAAYDKRIEHLEQLTQTIRDLFCHRSGKGIGRGRLQMSPGRPAAHASSLL